MSRLNICMNITLVVFILPLFAWADDEIEIDQIPAEVITAVKNEFPDIVIGEASMETEDGMTVYEIEGKSGDQKYEIEVSSDGRILEIEEDD